MARLKIDWSEAAQMYESGMSSVEIACHYGCSEHAVRNNLKAIGIKIRHAAEVDWQEAARMYEQGISARQIALKFGCGQTTVLKHLRKLGFDTSIKIGDQSPTWKGGRYENQGYVLIYSPDHPRVSHRDRKHRYVFEHILVMEKHLGRYLAKDEEVHHKCHFDKTNNDIRNLELWVGSQPPGGREDDVSDWCEDYLRGHRSTSLSEEVRNG